MCFKYSLSVSFEGLLQICALLKYGIYDIGHICPAEAELYTGCCLCTEEKGSPLWPGEVFFRCPLTTKLLFFSILCGKWSRWDCSDAQPRKGGMAVQNGMQE